MKNPFRKVLEVNDDLTSQYLCKMFLQDMQIAEDITAFEHGERALQFLKSSCIDNNAAPADCPDLVLLDLKMPVMDGLELLEELDKLKANHIIQNRVVMLTSSQYNHDLEKTRRYGVKGYIIKPLTEEKVRALLLNSDLLPTE